MLLEETWESMREVNRQAVILHDTGFLTDRWTPEFVLHTCKPSPSTERGVVELQAGHYKYNKNWTPQYTDDHGVDFSLRRARCWMLFGSDILQLQFEEALRFCVNQCDAAQISNGVIIYPSYQKFFSAKRTSIRPLSRQAVERYDQQIHVGSRRR